LNEPTGLVLDQSLSDTGVWSRVPFPYTTNFGNGCPVQQTLTNAVNTPQQFYRVKQLP
jgi:hypothetical protein